MFKMEDDPRIIGSHFDANGKYVPGIGNLIRKLSLDEFPQFFNVLLGDMSLVGTRPPTVDEYEKYKLHHKARLSAKPGITGMWQVSGRSDITDFEDVVKLDFTRDIYLYSQTTKSLDEFQEIVEYIKQNISPETTFEYYDTICRQVANRMPKLREFAASHDLIFFVSGKKSSNGKMLFEECLKVNTNSHLIDNEKEIDPSLLQNVNSIGVCGATSTPKWLMEKIYNHIRTLIKE